MGVIRSAFVSGTILNNPLAVGDTAFSSAGLSSLAAVASPDIAKLILDPAGSAGVPEVVYITAHTAAATTATIARGAEGSTARQHSSGIPWVNGPTLLEFGTPVSTTTATAYNPLQSYAYSETLLQGSLAALSDFAISTGAGNKAALIPMGPLLTDVTVTTLLVSIGTQNGNIDAGIYQFDGTTFTRIVSLGSTACPASTTPNFSTALNIADTVLYKGVRYYFALAADGTTATARRANNPWTTGGCYLQTTSFPLPATIAAAGAADAANFIMFASISGSKVA